MIRPRPYADMALTSIKNHSSDADAVATESLDWAGAHCQILWWGEGKRTAVSSALRMVASIVIDLRCGLMAVSKSNSSGFGSGRFPKSNRARCRSVEYDSRRRHWRLFTRPE